MLGLRAVGRVIWCGCAVRVQYRICVFKEKQGEDGGAKRQASPHLPYLFLSPHSRHVSLTVPLAQCTLNSRVVCVACSRGYRGTSVLIRPDGMSGASRVCEKVIGRGASSRVFSSFAGLSFFRRERSDGAEKNEVETPRGTAARLPCDCQAPSRSGSSGTSASCMPSRSCGSFRASSTSIALATRSPGIFSSASSIRSPSLCPVIAYAHEGQGRKCVSTEERCHGFQG